MTSSTENEPLAEDATQESKQAELAAPADSEESAAPLDADASPINDATTNGATTIDNGTSRPSDSFQPSEKKRRSDIQLNKDEHPEGHTCDSDDDDLNDEGGKRSDPFSRASEEVIKGRRILKAKKSWTSGGAGGVGGGVGGTFASVNLVAASTSTDTSTAKTTAATDETSAAANATAKSTMEKDGSTSAADSIVFGSTAKIPTFGSVTGSGFGSAVSYGFG